MIRPLTLAVLACLALPAAAQSSNDWLDEGRVLLNMRYRYEHVDQDNALRNANAQTLRTRLGYETGQWHGFSALVEMEHVGRLFGSHYNSTRNGRTNYSAVPDPGGTSLNQALLKHQGDYGMVSLGRQRINLDNQRFVGAVGWRQNEQTFDAALARLKASENLALTYAWLDKVHTIFGPDDNEFSNLANRARIDSNSHLLNLNWAIDPRFKLIGYHYRLDLKNAALTPSAPLGTLSSATTGLRVYGAAGNFDYTVEYARQKDIANNPWDLDSRYKLVELGYTINQLKLKLGLESLGGGEGEGNRAFQTPLATKHPFQGWADQFLTTPADGIDDVYIGAQLSLGEGNLQAHYHDFSSERGSTDFGTEINLAYSQPLRPWGLKGLTGTIKYARYDSDNISRSIDTDKFWLQLEYAY